MGAPQIAGAGAVVLLLTLATRGGPRKRAELASFTAITSIGFDHQLYLGTTLESIALEKAGIIKSGVPVVVGDIAPAPLAVIESVARERGAPVVRASVDDLSSFEVGLAGRHQLGNAARREITSQSSARSRRACIWRTTSRGGARRS